MAGSSTKLCPRCGSVVLVQEMFCRRCGADVRGAREGGPSVRYELLFYLLHIAAGVFAAFMFFLARGSDLELCGGLIFAIVLVSLSVHYRRRPQYRVSKSRRRAKRLMKRRVALHAPVDDRSGHRTLRIEGTVVWVADFHHDEVIVRTDSPILTTTNQRSDLLALAPVESGDSFVTLLEVGTMRVAIWLVGRAYLSMRRGNLLARRSFRRNPPVSLGQGLVVLEEAR